MKRLALSIVGTLLIFGALAAETSLQTLESRIAESPDDARVLYELTRRYCKLDSQSKAIESWRHLAELDPDLASDIYLITNVAAYAGVEPFFPQLISDSMIQAPRLSPDGKWIVFSAVIGGRMQIAEIDFFGSHYTKLTSGDSYNHSASFVDSEDEIIYGRFTEGKVEEIVHLDLKTGENNVILSDFMSQIETPDRPSSKLPLLFSYLSPDTRTTEIGLYDTRTGKFTELTQNRYSDRNARYSQKGKLIVYAVDNRMNVDIFIMNRKGKVIEQITDSRFNESQPDFGDNDNKIAFISNKFNDKYDVFIYDRRTKDVIPVTCTESIDTHPDLSNDGNWLVFDSNREGGPIKGYFISLNQPISVEKLLEEIDKKTE
ncbi:PD40 domain-containing protein [candidate division WOR-3 bacterium]|nr:PD40 domain-containing protein [candidate division WOR-3 bacterium]